MEVILIKRNWKIYVTGALALALGSNYTIPTFHVFAETTETTNTDDRVVNSATSSGDTSGNNLDSSTSATCSGDGQVSGLDATVFESIKSTLGLTGSPDGFDSDTEGTSTFRELVCSQSNGFHTEVSSDASIQSTHWTAWFKNNKDDTIDKTQDEGNYHGFDQSKASAWLQYSDELKTINNGYVPNNQDYTYPTDTIGDTTLDFWSDIPGYYDVLGDPQYSGISMNAYQHFAWTVKVTTKTVTFISNPEATASYMSSLGMTDPNSEEGTPKNKEDNKKTTGGNSSFWNKMIDGIKNNWPLLLMIAAGIGLGGWGLFALNSAISAGGGLSAIAAGIGSSVSGAGTIAVDGMLALKGMLASTLGFTVAAGATSELSKNNSKNESDSDSDTSKSNSKDSTSNSKNQSSSSASSEGKVGTSTSSTPSTQTSTSNNVPQQWTSTQQTAQNSSNISEAASKAHKVYESAKKYLKTGFGIGVGALGFGGFYCVVTTIQGKQVSVCPNVMNGLQSLVKDIASGIKKDDVDNVTKDKETLENSVNEAIQNAQDEVGPIQDVEAFETALNEGLKSGNYTQDEVNKATISATCSSNAGGDFDAMMACIKEHGGNDAGYFESGYDTEGSSCEVYADAVRNEQTGEVFDKQICTEVTYEDGSDTVKVASATVGDGSYATEIAAFEKLSLTAGSAGDKSYTVEETPFWGSVKPSYWTNQGSYTVHNDSSLPYHFAAESEVGSGENTVNVYANIVSTADKLFSTINGYADITQVEGVKKKNSWPKGIPRVCIEVDDKKTCTTSKTPLTRVELDISDDSPQEQIEAEKFVHLTDYYDSEEN